MSHSDQTNSWPADLIASHVRARETAETILDGRACLVCGAGHGAMRPVAEGPSGQVFAHVECNRAMEAKRR